MDKCDRNLEKMKNVKIEEIDKCDGKCEKSYQATRFERTRAGCHGAAAISEPHVKGQVPFEHPLRISALRKSIFLWIYCVKVLQ